MSGEAGASDDAGRTDAPLGRGGGDGRDVRSGASAVAFDGVGVLIEGPPGAGKSALALDCVALGALLIADDVVELRAAPPGVFLRAGGPESCRGLIEARGVGLLRLPAAATAPDGAPLRFVVELKVRTADRVSMPDHRLPALRRIRLFDHSFPLIDLSDSAHRATVVSAIARGAALLDPDDPAPWAASSERSEGP